MTISKGVQYMLFATFMFSIMQVLVKIVALPVPQIIFFRALISFVMSSIDVKRKNLSFYGNNKPMLIARGVFGSVSLFCFFYALQQAPLASVITIVNIKPFLVLFLGFFFLKEKIFVQQWLFFLLSFVGIIFVKGFNANISTFAFWCIIGSAVFAAIAHTLVRKLKDQDAPEVILLYFTFTTVPFVLPFMLYTWVNPDLTQWIYLILIGVVTHFGQLYLTKAYQSDRVANVSNLYFLGIGFAVFYGVFFFEEKYQLQTWLGFLLIVSGIVLNIIFGNKNIEFKQLLKRN